MKYNFEASLKRVGRQMYSFIDSLYYRELKDLGLMSFASKSLFPTEQSLEDYLKKRGYVKDKNRGVFCYKKDFTCVSISPQSVRYWHDTTGPDTVYGRIPFDELVFLPDALNYMERL
jgi:hypothetical protein